MADDIAATDPVDVAETTPVEPDGEAPASRVGLPTGDTEPLPGTEAMGAETGGLAGTSR